MSLGEESRGAVEHLFDLAVCVIEEVLHPFGVVAFEVWLVDCVDECSVGLVCGHPACACVWLGQISLLVEVDEFVSDGGR